MRHQLLLTGEAAYRETILIRRLIQLAFQAADEESTRGFHDLRRAGGLQIVFLRMHHRTLDARTSSVHWDLWSTGSDFRQSSLLAQ